MSDFAMLFVFNSRIFEADAEVYHCKVCIIHLISSFDYHCI